METAMTANSYGQTWHTSPDDDDDTPPIEEYVRNSSGHQWSVPDCDSASIICWLTTTPVAGPFIHLIRAIN